MRILYQCQALLPDVVGGAEVLSGHLLQGLMRRGHQVLAMTTAIGGQAPGLYDHDGIAVRKFAFGEALMARDLSAIADLCAQVDRHAAALAPDILMQTDTGSSAFFFLRRRAARNVPRLLTLHSPFRDASRDVLQNQLMDDADVIAAVSQSLLGDAAAAMPRAAHKLTLLRNALPLPAIAPVPLPLSPPNLLCIGRLVNDKGMDVAIRALGIARAQGCAAGLTIAGDGPARPRLEALARELGLEAQVTFTGWIAAEAVAHAMNRACAVLVPSRWREPFGLVALEALQMGRPVIASHVGGLPEIVTPETGVLVPPDDPQALAAAMVSLLRAPQGLIAMGEQARLRARTVFDFSHLVDAYEAAIRRTVAARTPERMEA